MYEMTLQSGGPISAQKLDYCFGICYITRYNSGHEARLSGVAPSPPSSTYLELKVVVAVLPLACPASETALSASSSAATASSMISELVKCLSSLVLHSLQSKEEKGACRNTASDSR